MKIENIFLNFAVDNYQVYTSMNGSLHFMICVFLVLCIALDFVIIKNPPLTCFFFLYLRALIVYTGVALEFCNFREASIFLEINSPKPYTDLKED